jgi:predicted lipoprotein with Yx(FWY)xxD motif
MNYYEPSLLETASSSGRGSRRKHLRLAVAPIALVAVALVAAGCGGGGGGTGYGAAPQQKSGGSSSTLRLAGLKPGKALVDGQGRTLYLFEADKGDASTCSGACASIWPPVTTTAKAIAGAGVTAVKLGTTKRSDGKLQVTYNGHPLYRYAADNKPGDVNGQGIDQFGAKWYVLNASGAKIDND